MKTVIFDFDGTIADSFESVLTIFEEITKRPEKLTTKEIDILRGQSLRQIIKYLKIKKWQLPGMVFKAKKLIGMRITEIKTFPDMPETLRQLRDDGCGMYILSTNSADNIGKFLKKNDLDGYFAGISGDIGLQGKASALKKIIRKYKLGKSNCYYIGDEVRDVQGAKKAGVTSVGVTWGFNDPAAIKAAGPDYTADLPKDLLKILA